MASLINRELVVGNLLDRIDALEQQVKALQLLAGRPGGGPGNLAAYDEATGVLLANDGLKLGDDPGSPAGIDVTSLLKLQVFPAANGERNAVAMFSVGEHVLERDQLDGGANGTALGVRRRNMGTAENRAVLRLAARTADKAVPAAGFGANLEFQGTDHSGDEDENFGGFGFHWDNVASGNMLAEFYLYLLGDSVDVPLRINNSVVALGESGVPVAVGHLAPDAGAALHAKGGDTVIEDGSLVLKRTGPIIISGGVITADSSYMQIDTEGAAATDDLDTINGGAMGKLLVLRSEVNTREIVVKHNVGNIRLHGGADFTLTTRFHRLTLLFDGSQNAWIELARAEVT